MCPQTHFCAYYIDLNIKKYFVSITASFCVFYHKISQINIISGNHHGESILKFPENDGKRTREIDFFSSYIHAIKIDRKQNRFSENRHTLNK